MPCAAAYPPDAKKSPTEKAPKKPHLGVWGSRFAARFGTGLERKTGGSQIKIFG